MNLRPKGATSVAARRLRTGAAAALLVALAACSGGEAGAGGSAGAADGSAATSPGAGSSSTTVRVPDSQLGNLTREDLKLSLPWTRGTIRRSAPDSADTTSAIVASVSYSQVGGVDRMTVEFDSTGGLPDYEVSSSIAPLPRCASPDTIPIQGQGLLKIRLQGTTADSAVTGPPTAHPKLDNVSTVYRSCLRPTSVEWVMDVRRATYYRVLEAANPPRLVVDVQQRLEGSEADSAGDAAGD